jgi:hypothetical protein
MGQIRTMTVTNSYVLGKPQSCSHVRVRHRDNNNTDSLDNSVPTYYYETVNYCIQNVDLPFSEK